MTEKALVTEYDNIEEILLMKYIYYCSRTRGYVSKFHSKGT